MHPARRVAAVAAAALLAGACTQAVADVAVRGTSASAPLPASGGASGPATAASRRPVKELRPASAAPTPAASTSAASTAPLPRATAVPARAPAVSRPAAPTRLRIASASVDARVEAVGVREDGQMELPGDPDVAGWYRHGAAPGEVSGSAVIAAHVTAQGRRGALYPLAQVQAGQVVLVTGPKRILRYRITSVVAESRGDVDLARLFSRSGAPRLHIVTCAGRWDPVRRSYDNTLVVTAVPVPTGSAAGR